MFRASGLVPGKLRTALLAAAEIGKGRNADLRLALLPKRKRLLVDIGANRGQFARFLAPFYDRIVAFEPIETFSAELRTFLPSNCAVHTCALADAAGSATFYIPNSENRYDVQTASLVEPSMTGTHDEVTVEVRRLDDFAIDDVSFIKIDVEGAEYDVLRGAKETIARCRPILLVEIEDRHTGGNSQRVFNLLRDLRYRSFIQADDQLRSYASSILNLMRGLAYATRAIDIPLKPVDRQIDNIHENHKDLNTSLGYKYINNFIFLP